MERKSSVERLVKKIEEELGIVCDPETFCRTRAGYWQKRQGAFSWEMYLLNSNVKVGSCDTVSECVKRKYRLTISRDGEICAEERIRGM